MTERILFCVGCLLGIVLILPLALASLLVPKPTPKEPTNDNT